MKKRLEIDEFDQGLRAYGGFTFEFGMMRRNAR